MPTDPGPKDCLPDDAQLVELARAGDEAALGELFVRCRDAMLAAARRVTRDTTSAEDAVSEALTGFLAALRRGSGPRNNVRGYLARSARNAALRQSSAPPVARLEKDPVDDADTERDVTQQDTMRRAFDTLSPRWQTVLWCTEVQGLSRDETADRLGGSPAAIAMVASRAREGLRRAYLAMHIPPSTSESCRDVRQDLAVFVRGGPRGREQIARHLDACSSCEGVVKVLVSINVQLDLGRRGRRPQRAE